MDNDSNDSDNDSYNPHSHPSDNNTNSNSNIKAGSTHDAFTRHSSSPSEFYSQSKTDAHFSPVAVRDPGTPAKTDDTSPQWTNTTSIIAIDSLAITSSSSSTSRPRKAVKKGVAALKGTTTLAFPFSSATSMQGPSSTISSSAAVTTATASMSTELSSGGNRTGPAAVITGSSSSPPISTTTPSYASSVSRLTRTGRHNRGERMTFELDDVLREYTPDQFKTCKAYDVGGVNILNKKPVDSKTALDKIKRRRETHNRVERRRRDCINQLIDELTALLPKEDDSDMSKSHRVNILRTAIAHIQNLTRQNENLQQQVDALRTGQPMPPPAIITTLAPMMDYDDSETAYSDNLTSPAAAPSYSAYSPRSPSPAAASSYSAYSPRSPLSPSVSAGGGGGGGAYLPFSSSGGPTSHRLTPPSAHGRGSHQDWNQPPGQLSPPSGGSGVPSTSYSNETTASITASMPDIPMIVEPSEQVSTLEMGSSGLNSKRLNRQTLPRLQLAPPPFHQHSQHNNQQQPNFQHQHQHPHQGYQQQYQQHYNDHSHRHPHHRNRSNSGGGFPQSPSYYGTDSASATSPNSAYSDYSSSTGPWSSSSGGPYSAGLRGSLSGGGVGGGGGGPQSSTSSSFGTSPRSPHFSNYGPPSPYSPYGPSSAHAQMSPSPGLAPWNAVSLSSSPASVPHHPPQGSPPHDLHPSSPRP
ncbi:MAG: hypothetical protein J3R72DRAFT_444246 [Linnemannia gamsii]|nr:MAG: hypothetical protein J3R72DRAFT_444246 [Linnemannia gamsii]